MNRDVIIDTSRHIQVWDPRKFNDTIDIVGAGATGSTVALALAKLGATKLRVIDFDGVEQHNIANQMFNLEHVGLPKTTALAEVVEKASGCVIEEIVGSAPEAIANKWSPYVFLLTDTMKSRKEIFDSIERSCRTRLMIETRLGIDLGRVYTIEPTSESETERWKATLTDDEVATESFCRTQVTMGPTVMVLAGIAAWYFVQYVNWMDDPTKNSRPPHELIFGLRPFSYVSNVWS